MADAANPTPTPTASTQQPDMAANLATLTGVVTQLAQTVRTQQQLQQALQGGQPQQQAAQAAGKKDGPLTAGDVTRIVQEALQGQQQATQQAAARQQYAAGKLKDLPPGYEQRLGSDPAKWPAEEQALRTEYRAFLDAQGVKAPDVGGGNAGGTSAAAVVDVSKLKPTQLISQGLKDARTQGGSTTTVTTRTQPGATAPAAGTTQQTTQAAAAT